MFNRSNLLRAAVLAFGVTLGVPALADTDMIPITGAQVGSTYGGYTGRAASAAPSASQGYFRNEPGTVAGARGASGVYVARTPLASVAPNLSATDAYGAALNEATN